MCVFTALFCVICIIIVSPAPPLPSQGVSRVLECCQECGVGALVFMSSSRVISARNAPDLADENLPFVTCQENKTAHAIAMAEVEVLKARRVTRAGCDYMLTMPHSTTAHIPGSSGGLG